MKKFIISFLVEAESQNEAVNKIREVVPEKSKGGFDICYTNNYNSFSDMIGKVQAFELLIKEFEEFKKLMKK